MTSHSVQKESKDLRDRNQENTVKWKELNCKFEKEVTAAKNNYYKNIVKDLKMSNPGRWYSILKRICSYDQHKSDPVSVSKRTS
jgi:hypothetical protein